MIPFSTTVLQVTATTGALTLRKLIDAAFSGTVDYSKGVGAQPDHIEIDSEGDIRFTVDGSAPTSSTGLRAAATTGILVYEGVSIDQMRLYGSNVKVNVQIGWQGKQ